VSPLRWPIGRGTGGWASRVLKFVGLGLVAVAGRRVERRVRQAGRLAAGG
jgi:hypothetical protein